MRLQQAPRKRPRKRLAHARPLSQRQLSSHPRLGWARAIRLRRIRPARGGYGLEACASARIRRRSVRERIPSRIIRLHHIASSAMGFIRIAGSVAGLLAGYIKIIPKIELGTRQRSFIKIRVIVFFVVFTITQRFGFARLVTRVFFGHAHDGIGPWAIKIRCNIAFGAHAVFIARNIDDFSGFGIACTRDRIIRKTPLRKRRRRTRIPISRNSA